MWRLDQFTMLGNWNIIQKTSIDVNKEQFIAAVATAGVAVETRTFPSPETVPALFMADRPIAHSILYMTITRTFACLKDSSRHRISQKDSQFHSKARTIHTLGPRMLTLNLFPDNPCSINLLLFSAGISVGSLDLIFVRFKVLLFPIGSA